MLEGKKIRFRKQLVKFDELPSYYQEKILDLHKNKSNKRKIENGTNTKAGSESTGTNTKAGSESTGTNTKAGSESTGTKGSRSKNAKSSKVTKGEKDCGC